MKHHQILIIGGGNAGLSIAAQLLRKNKKLDIGIIEPSAKHYYQPAWTLVGAGTFDVQETEKSQADYIPERAEWIRNAASAFDPENNTVTCSNGDIYSYDALVVVPGIQLDWDKIEDLPDTLGQNAVTSNYTFKTAPYTWELIKNFKGGTAVFTNPPTPVKCGGAPMKIMWLACDYWRKKGILDKCNVQFLSGGTILFGVPEYRKTLEKVAADYGVHLHFHTRIIRIDGPGKTVYYETKDEAGNLIKNSMKFDMMHVTPPQSAPDFVKESKLADPATPLGWVEVDKHSFQHKRYPNVFSCGDVCNAPASRTGAAIRKQAPVLVDHLLAHLDHKTSNSKYNGYSACPIPTRYGRLMLAEFDYDNKPAMSFPFDQTKPRYSMWLLKKKVLPWLYWNRILSGKA